MKARYIAILCLVMIGVAHADMVSNQADFGGHVTEPITSVEALVKLMNARGVASANLHDRLSRMSPTERAQLYTEFERLPAGAGMETITVVLIGTGFLVMSDYMGFTDVFPFIKAEEKTE